MTASPRTPRRLLRAIALCALLLAGLLGDSIHRAQVHHAICPEHGELVEVATHTIDASRAKHEETSRCQREHVEAGDESGGDHHDACFLASMPKAESVAAAPTLTFEPDFPLVLHAEVSATIATPPSIPRYLLAPKNSPPV